MKITSIEDIKKAEADIKKARKKLREKEDLKIARFIRKKLEVSTLKEVEEYFEKEDFKKINPLFPDLNVKNK